MSDISPHTEFGRLIEAFGKNTDNWRDKKVDIKIDEQNKKHIYPVKPEVQALLAT
jgi:hypothetical protein